MNWFAYIRSHFYLLVGIAVLSTPCFTQSEGVKKTEPMANRLNEAGVDPISFRPATKLPEITVAMGKSMIADAVVPMARVSLASPNIADTYVISPTQLLITGKAAGTTTLFVWDKNGKLQSYEIVVQPDVALLRARIKEAFPTDEINVTTLNDSVILSGPPADEYTAKKALEMVAPVTKNVINLLQPPPPKEKQRILLQVKIAEIDRSKSRDLGINFFNLGQGKMVNTVATGQFPSVAGQGSVSGVMPRTPLPFSSTMTLSDSLNIFAFRPDINLGATIRDLENRSLLQILAEPNLLAYNGKEATFLAGGEFAIPVVQGVGLGQTVTVQFRPFGVRLAFTPTLMSNGAIHLKLSPEVSTIDFSNASTIGGFRVPGLNTRRVETEIELNEGESFGIAGLIDNRVIESYSKIPMLSSIPVIGALFKSSSKSKNNSELLVLVTPRIIQPFRPEAPPTLPETDVPYLREPKLEGKMGVLGLPPVRGNQKSSEPRLDGKSGVQDAPIVAPVMTDKPVNTDEAGRGTGATPHDPVRVNRAEPESSLPEKNNKHSSVPGALPTIPAAADETKIPARGKLSP
ncbi:MAG: pilus assembly protein N-terminal domain-containing protein [Acidobacteria bacterium]|nr:pilus assembly protein N-terminal domain-containing protein [Acidobacteriota bacterium]